LDKLAHGFSLFNYTHVMKIAQKSAIYRDLPCQFCNKIATYRMHDFFLTSKGDPFGPSR
jgi:hypothetical protein